jgi:hypothetical protein
LKFANRGAKPLSALLEIAELILTRARGREQHHVSRLRELRRALHGFFE